MPAKLMSCVCVAWLMAACSGDVSSGAGEGASASEQLLHVIGAGGAAPPALERTLAIEIATLACAGDCADIQAVAHGGRSPYAFRWEDGSTDPIRQLCPALDGQLRVTATDTSSADAESPYAGQIASASVDTVDCSGVGAPPPAGEAL